MIKKANIDWSAKALVKNTKDGNVSFDLAIQRGFCWDNSRKSLLIHSMIEGYPIPPFFFAKREDKGYDGLDGKQRTETIMSYMDGTWVLDDDFIVSDSDGNDQDFSGYKFSDLPEWVQDAIKEYSFLIYYFEDLTEDQYQEMFYRLNNGKVLTATELTRVRTQSLSMFQEMAQHDIINLAVTERGKVKFAHEQLAMQAWAAVFALDEVDELSFETKVFRPFMEKAEINQAHMNEMQHIFNIIYNMYNSCDMTDKAEKKVAAKIKTRTHFVALAKTIAEAIDADYEIGHLIDWIKVFFSGKNGSSIDESYNSAACGSVSGTAKRKNIDARINAMIANMNQYMERVEQQNDTSSTSKGKSQKSDVA